MIFYPLDFVVASRIYGLKCRGENRWNGKLKDSLNRNVREAQPCDPTFLGYGNTNDLRHRRSTKRAPFFFVYEGSLHWVQ
jgi:hypothetical protein